jgi:DNA-binding transcriptional LysR family regulator
MILRQMRYFAAVARHGGFGRAAAELHLAQPALSRQIREFEREIGAPLFDRDRQGVRLTSAGMVLREHAEALLASLDRASRRARLAHAGKLGTVRLGLGRVALGNGGIGKAIADVGAGLPDVALVINEVASLSQPQALRSGELQLAIGVEGMRTDATLRRQALFPDSVDRALLSTTHPLAKASRVKPAQLRGERLMMLPSATAPFPELYDALRELGFSEWEEHESPETIYSLVVAGRGWTTHLRSVGTPPGTVAVPLTGLDVPMSIVIRWSAQDESLLTRNVVNMFLKTSPTAARSGTRKRAAATATSHPSGPGNLELRHLHALIAVLEEGSMIAAARRLGLTQSGLARQVRALEREVDVPLLKRKQAGVLATQAGEVFRAEATAALKHIDEAIAQARRAGRGVTTGCNIGVIPSELMGDLVSAVLDDLSRRRPDVGVEVREVLTPRQLDALRAREIDIGIASAVPGLVDDPAIDSIRLKEDVVDCALVAASHPLAAKAVLAPKDLADVPFLFIDHATFPKLHELVLQTFAELGLTPRIDAAVNGPRAVWSLAAEGLGWTIGTRTLRANPPPGVAAIPIEGFMIPTGVQLLWRRGEASPSVRAVLDAFHARPQR